MYIYYLICLYVYIYIPFLQILCFTKTPQVWECSTLMLILLLFHRFWNKVIILFKKNFQCVYSFREKWLIVNNKIVTLFTIFWPPGLLQGFDHPEEGQVAEILWIEWQFYCSLFKKITTVEPHLSGHLRSQSDCPDNWISG